MFSEYELLARIDKTDDALDRWKTRLTPGLPASGGGAKDFPNDSFEAVVQISKEIQEMDDIFVARLKEENKFLKEQITKLYEIIDNQSSNKKESHLPVIAIAVAILTMLPPWIALFRKGKA